jgi:AraC family transcriptional regulator of adaptative response/methylated-DNA-[protein]-cysteine methyltransferase
MATSAHINYQRIAEAIHYIQTHFKEQPNLEEVARKIHLSPFHFQRLFREWAGTSPKKFLQYTTVEYAKKLLKENQATLFDTAYETGLSGTSRLHDLFIQIEGMTPAEYKNGGKNLRINYSLADSPFGNIIVAATEKGICYMAFADDESHAIAKMQQHFPQAHFIQMMDELQEHALTIFTNDWTNPGRIKLHLKGTAFQLKVWQTLLKIPVGQLTTYGSIAHQMEHPKAYRAVGTAIGHNPIAYIIPCHRVIQSTGLLGDYMWGPPRKTAIIGWGGSQSHQHYSKIRVV